jgi:hypothetical protein
MQVYELFQVQRTGPYKDFADRLNRLRVGDSSNEDHQWFQAQSDVTTDMVKWPTMFYTNKECDAHNTHVYHTLQTESVIATASDVVVNPVSPFESQRVLNAARVLDPKKCMGLLYTLSLKVGMPVEYTCNAKGGDGLTNSARGTVKAFTLMANCAAPDVIWVAFDSPSVGRTTRAAHAPFYARNPGIHPLWTPIYKTALEFKTGISDASKVQRTQFPLRCAAGFTVHHSQGQSLPQAVINLSSAKRVPALHYVAVSRLTNPNNLRIVGWNPNYVHTCSAVKAEMHRLHTHKPFPITHPFFSLSFPNIFIGTLNVRSYVMNTTYIQKDITLQRFFLLHFTETRMANTDPPVDNCYYMHTNSRHSSHGSLIKCCAPLQNKQSQCTGTYEILACEIHLQELLTQVIGVYRQPNQNPIHTFLKSLHRMLQTSTAPHRIIMGDFNTNFLFNSKDLQALMDVLKQYNLQQVVTTPTCGSNIIDHIWLDEQLANRLQCSVTDMFFTDHRLAFLHLPNQHDPCPTTTTNVNHKTITAPPTPPNHPPAHHSSTTKLHRSPPCPPLNQPAKKRKSCSLPRTQHDTLHVTPAQYSSVKQAILTVAPTLPGARQVSHHDILTLRDNTFLNDTVLDIFFDSMHTITPTSHNFLTTGFTASLRNMNRTPNSITAEGALRMFCHHGSQNPQACITYIPALVNGNHWILLIHNAHDNTIHVLDSLNTTLTTDVQHISQLLQAVLCLSGLSTTPPQIRLTPTGLMQPNGYDCGVYVCNAALSMYLHGTSRHTMLLHVTRNYLRSMIASCIR